ncbi:MAG: DNA polymerase III subunit gamma/tau [Lachnospiraceae bacterium]|nr:DNA polymerase III subunit gamma/tau [Lachnospiraceae bacterium]
MSYTALYRKFRPDSFEEVKGQGHIVTTLKNQIKAQRIGHAYLFCGTRGTGKTSVAKVFAKAVNCEHPIDGSPCGTCEMCREIAAGTSMNVIEIDAASNNGVDNIREIREEVTYRPTRGRYKVYIIDEVHMLSTGAFNALLKTLEEPPSYVIFILATTEVHKIPVTIMSRCQRYDFKRITVETLMNRMQELMDHEQVQVEEKALRYIAKSADGAMRDALSLLDQCIAFHLGEVLTYDKVLEVLGAVDTEVFGKLLRKILAQDVTGSIGILEDMVIQGKEIGQFVIDFTWYLRNLLMVKTSENPSDAVDVSTEQMAELQEIGQSVEVDTLLRYIRVLSELSNQLRYTTQRRVLVEIGLVKLCRPQMEVSQDALLERIRVLEEKLEEWENNPPVQIGAQPGSVMYGGAVGSDPAAVQTKAAPQKEKPPVAAPEDLQRIRADWRALVGQTDGMLKTMLNTAVPKYNGATGENKLFIEFTNPLAQNYVDRPDARQLMEDIIAKRYGKTVEVEMRIAGQNQTQGLSEISVDEQIREKIHMDVIVEEE